MIFLHLLEIWAHLITIAILHNLHNVHNTACPYNSAVQAERDKHTCQSCGRKAPEVVLEVDHLLPVAKGGTDDFDNLITSCKDCNRGKYTKLIEDFTGGLSKEEWRKRLLTRRAEVLKQRRLQLNDVLEHWAKCRGRKQVSDYDTAFVFNLIERYEPEWIKAAIQIAVKHSPSNYGKYTSGILRNWAKNGPPDFLGNPDASLDKRKATPKQVAYIQGLWRKLALEWQTFTTNKILSL